MKIPFPLQQDGIDFLAGGGVMLADEPGCGKTLQTIEARRKLPSDLPALVFCPATVLTVWRNEIAEQMPDASILILKGTNLKKLTKQKWDWIICSTDLPGRSPKVAEALRKHRYAVMAVDEAHYLKNRQAKRTQALITRPERISKQADRLWFLTGTPTPNHVGELWAMIATTAPDRIKRLRYPDYEEHFCTHKMRRRPGFRGKMIEERVVAGSNIPVVQRDLLPALEGWWIRRKKDAMVEEFPDKFRRTVPLSVGKLDPELTALLDSPEGLALQRMIKGKFMDIPANDPSLSRLGRLMALTKATAAADYVKHIIEDEDAPGVVVWFWHTEAMNRFAEALSMYHCRIDGSTPQSQRGDIVKRFQHPDGPKVFLGQIRAAGTGITLTKATRAVFVEAFWTPEANLQAEDRIHRIGQKFNVQIDYLAVDNSIDDLVMGVIAKKMDEWASIERALPSHS